MRALLLTQNKKGETEAEEVTLIGKPDLIGNIYFRDMQGHVDKLYFGRRDSEICGSFYRCDAQAEEYMQAINYSQARIKALQAVINDAVSQLWVLTIKDLEEKP